MAKLAIDRASIVFGKKNREIFFPNREIGRFSLFYQKSGDLPKNRETWKLCINFAHLCTGEICFAGTHMFKTLFYYITLYTHEKKVELDRLTNIKMCIKNI